MGLKHAVLQAICRLPVRGRHRLANRFGGGGTETLPIGEITLPLDLSLEFHRYVYYGIYEGDFVAHLRRTLRPGDTFIDPGTNIGYISAVAANLVGPAGKVIALEPSRTCHDRLKSYLAAPNLELLMAAIHSRSGKARFFDTPRVLLRGFACLAEVEEPEDGTGYEVDAWTVDDICAARGLAAVRYLKLDVEGAELMALQGATRMLAEAAIDYILVETEFSRPVTAEINALLAGNGYRPFKADPSGRLHAVPVADLKQGRFDVIWASPRMPD